MVPSAEFSTHGSHGQLGDFSHYVHSDLPGIGNRGISLAGANVGGGHAKSAAYFFDDFFDCYRGRLVVIDNVANSRLSRTDIGGLFLPEGYTLSAF